MDNHIECDDGQFIISRQFHRSGRGSILVNGTLTPIAVIRRIASFVLDIHGQYDNRLIFDPTYHVQILDGLTPELRKAREEYGTVYEKWRSLCQEAKALQRMKVRRHAF